MAEPVRTTCPYCGVGCGVLVTAKADGSYVVKGDPDHPANFGRLCSKGAALGETLGDEGRLLTPRMEGKDVTWDAALDRVAKEFNDAIDAYGADSVAFYVSGQLMTEAYYVANKLMKGYIGSANIDTNSRLCMASSVAGHKRAFGSDTVPGNYEDLELADMVVLVGSNLAWCHPVLHQRLTAAKKTRGTHIVVIDPRKTATCDIADQHLALKPGTDVKLFNGLLSHMAARGSIETAFVDAHTTGMEEALEAARLDGSDIRSVVDICGLETADVSAFFKTFRRTSRVVTIYSQGVNQSSQGADKVNAIINCHLLTGRVGKAGCGPFSVTGQPNAMGGREVGGLANTLAAHMDFDEASVNRVRRFWKAPRMAKVPGLKAVDMFDAIETGKIKAVWVMATNPAVSLPDANRVRRALELCRFVAVSDCVARNDTIQYADVVLPTTTWGERDGTVTNSERRISRQRPFRTAPDEAREDWDIICDVAERLGYGDAFDFSGPADIFIEHAKLSAFENDGSRDFDLSGLADIDPQSYDTMSPVQWPVRRGGQGPQERMFTNGAFFTPNRRARFVPVRHRHAKNQTNPDFPLVLNTGRVRDHWHAMTRTGMSPRLSRHRAEPTIDVHPVDAATCGLTEGGLAKLTSVQGEAVVRVGIDDGQQPGGVFVPIHWNDANSANAVVNRLVNAATDPFSGQPELKFTPVSIKAYETLWHALVVTRTYPINPQSAYWTRIAGDGCVLTAMAGNEDVTDWQAWAEQHAGRSDLDWLSYSDPAGGKHRFAAFMDGALQAAVFVSRTPALPGLEWVRAQFALDALDEGDRAGLLAGRAPGDASDPGPVVCACFSVGINALRLAIAEGTAPSVEAVGQALQAGTGCGSCKPEIQALLDRELPESNPVSLHREVA